jgi:hypothetical protein
MSVDCATATLTHEVSSKTTPKEAHVSTLALSIICIEKLWRLKRSVLGTNQITPTIKGRRISDLTSYWERRRLAALMQFEF